MIGQSAIGAAAIGQTSVSAPQAPQQPEGGGGALPEITLDANLIPKTRWIRFEGNGRVVTFEGNTRVVTFEGNNRTIVF